MAEVKGNTAVPHEGDHDRVVMLSLRADGTPDQHNPEIIGDKEFAVESAKRQFAEQAVSAADVAERGASAAPAGAELVGQDPEIERMQGIHASAAAEAEKAAQSTVESLHQGDGDPAAADSKPTGRTSTGTTGATGTTGGKKN